MHQRTGRGRTIQKTCCVIIFCVCPFAATMFANGDPMNLLVKPFALLVHFLFKFFDLLPHVVDMQCFTGRKNALPDLLQVLCILFKFYHYGSPIRVSVFRPSGPWTEGIRYKKPLFLMLLPSLHVTFRRPVFHDSSCI